MGGGAGGAGTGGGVGPGQGGEVAAVVGRRVLRGHVNEKNFVGLSVSPEGYIACGSETNQVFAYHSSMPLPLATHSFAAGGGAGEAQLRLEAAMELAEGPAGGSHFVSCACWSKHGTLLAANSQGILQVLALE